MKISLVCATVGRPFFLRELLASLESQQHRDFEIIVVDQSEDSQTERVAHEYSAVLDLKYIRSGLGLSKARNAGLRIATGDVVCFPDDDCTYYPDTLSSVAEIMQDRKRLIVLGRIYDRKLGRNVMRPWPSSATQFGRLRTYTFGSSICIFSRRTHISMDERFGAGATYGCCEDIDYCWRYLDLAGNISYFPTIEVNHPELNIDVMSLEKVRRYAFGAGGLYAKHRAYAIFFMSVVLASLRVGKSVLSFNRRRMRHACGSMSMRFAGFFHYKQHCDALQR